MTHTAQTHQGRPAQPNPVRPPAPAPASAEPAPALAAAAAATPAADEIDLAFIESGLMTLAPELANQAAPQRARSDKQAAMDARCEKLHAAWVKASKPSVWAKLVETNCVATYFVEPEKTASLKKLVRRAATFHDVRVRWGTSFKATETLIAKYNLPKEYLGREVVSFAIMDKRPRAANGTATATK